MKLWNVLRPFPEQRVEAAADRRPPAWPAAAAGGGGLAAAERPLRSWADCRLLESPAACAAFSDGAHETLLSACLLKVSVQCSIRGREKQKERFVDVGPPHM